MLPAITCNSPLCLMPAGLGSISYAEPAKSASTAAPAAADQATAVAKGRKLRQTPAASPAVVQATRTRPPRAAKTKQAVERVPAKLNAQADTTKLGRPRRAAAAPAEPAAKQAPPARATRGKPAAKPAAAPAGRAAVPRTRSTRNAAMNDKPAHSEPSAAVLDAPLDTEAASALLELSASATRKSGRGRVPSKAWWAVDSY